MKILVINNDGGGYANHTEVEGGLTVGKLVARHLPGRDPADYLIRVNRQPCTADQFLAEGDRVSMTPVKIEGAISSIA